MTVMSYLGAIGAAQKEAMVADDRVLIIGEDVEANVYGTTGGAGKSRAVEGDFTQQFGRNRGRTALPWAEPLWCGRFRARQPSNRDTRDCEMCRRSAIALSAADRGVVKPGDRRDHPTRTRTRKWVSHSTPF
jgi:hypothetical protein